LTLKRPPRLILPGRFRAAVFDMDGILLDTEPLWNQAFAGVVTRRGGVFTSADWAATKGQSLVANSRYLARRVDASATVIEAEIATLILAEYLAGAPVGAGAGRLVRTLGGRMPIAVATNTQGSVARRALEAAGLPGFGVVASGADLGRPKPHPDVYLEACRQLGVAPGDAVAFEDSPIGVRSAVDAGLTVVGVPEDGVDLAAAGAHVVLASLEDVVVRA